MKIKIFESFIKDLEFNEIIDEIVPNIPDSDLPSEVGGIRKIKDYFRLFLYNTFLFLLKWQKNLHQKY